jgi:hypothetical protein
VVACVLAPLSVVAVWTRNQVTDTDYLATVQTVKAQLVAAGFTLAERIPAVDASLVLFRSEGIARARTASTCSTPRESGYRSSPWSCWQSGCTWPATTGGPWSGPPWGWRQARSSSASPS